MTYTFDLIVASETPSLKFYPDSTGKYVFSDAFKAKISNMKPDTPDWLYSAPGSTIITEYVFNADIIANADISTGTGPTITNLRLCSKDWTYYGSTGYPLPIFIEGYVGNIQPATSTVDIQVRFEGSTISDNSLLYRFKIPQYYYGSAEDPYHGGPSTTPFTNVILQY